MKAIAIVIAIIFLPQLVYSQNKKMINEIEKYENNNIYFYVGNIGMINNDLFIKRHDTNNVIYSKSGGGVVFGKDTNILNCTQIIKIIKKEKEFFFRQVNSIDSDPHDLFIVFGKDAIYILDFSSKKFGKYIR